MEDPVLFLVKIGMVWFFLGFLGYVIFDWWLLKRYDVSACFWIFIMSTFSGPIGLLSTVMTIWDSRKEP